MFSDLLLSLPIFQEDAMCVPIDKSLPAQTLLNFVNKKKL